MVLEGNHVFGPGVGDLLGVKHGSDLILQRVALLADSRADQRVHDLGEGRRQ